jgi:phosphoribosylaminoimidazolecarboxamide formyltransferase/IMP cyclohydrolase
VERAGISRAIISVSDKRGLVDFARALAARGVDILSTGGTQKELEKAGVKCRAISAHTGFPEILEGRVKTLHPKVHGGLLGRPVREHQQQMEEHGIDPIDLVVVNLYPFQETIARQGIQLGEAIEQIDIGGPSMLRSAAKNFERVTVVVDPDDYPGILRELEQTNGHIRAATRFRLAKKVFATTAAYDGAIAAFLSNQADDAAFGTAASDFAFPRTLTLQYAQVQPLRYGENPHQHAAFYRFPEASVQADLSQAEVLQGKELSYNNILDLDAALGCVLEFSTPTAVIVKHTNPCGVASAADIAEAYVQARSTDPTSAFGGIVALNREVDGKLAEHLAETFLECVIAPGFTDAAKQVLSSKKNLRLLAVGRPERRSGKGWAIRSVAGGLLVQTADSETREASAGKVVSKRAPTQAELAALDFVWRVAKHVKSNAIVYGRGEKTIAIGAGQMSRIDSARIAKQKAQSPLEGTVAASDAFFPFRDGLDVLAEAGATAVIQPGGSVRDDEVIQAADEHGMAMVFTGMRHFRH